MTENGWKEYQNLVLADLKRLQEAIKRLDTKFELRYDKIENRCTTIEVKLAGIQAVSKEKARKWGLQGALVPAGIAIIISIVILILRLIEVV
jgi:hypothetical protein